MERRSAGSIDARELARWRAEGRPHTLLDVREPDEVEYASLAGALHVPMRDVPASLDRLPHDVPIVVMCHAGGRSQQVAHFLAARGFTDVYNFEGGIDAWASEVDTSVPRY